MNTDCLFWPRVWLSVFGMFYQPAWAVVGSQWVELFRSAIRYLVAHPGNKLLHICTLPTCIIMERYSRKVTSKLLGTVAEVAAAVDG